MSADTIAVGVNHVSKIYHLWNSPKDRLIYPLKRAVNSLLPSGLRVGDAQVPGYKEFHALEDISFEIRKGESWGFIGVNGSGKSTLLKIISGNLRPSAGTVEVDGKVAILDYGSGFNGDFTGRENVFLKGSLLGLSRKQLDERFEAIEAFADIGQFINQPVKTYSSGMSARLGFAIMAHVDAEILITDEALAVGDAFFVQKCMRHIRSFLRHGTFLFVSHSVNDVMGLCTHAVWLGEGRVLKIGKAREICQAYMDSIVRRKSERLEQEGPASDDDELSFPENAPIEESVEPAPQPSKQSAAKSISISADELAALKNHYAPGLDGVAPTGTTQFVISEPVPAPETVYSEAALGGGRIFSVTITNNENKALPSIIGGEIVSLTIRAVAEKLISRPLLGFQLMNYLGLSLIGENTHLPMGDEDFALQPGDVVSAQFRFMMPLLGSGAYVIRVAFHDGTQLENKAVDVINEALLLNCITSGDRHGLVGPPMLAVKITRDANADVAILGISDSGVHADRGSS